MTPCPRRALTLLELLIASGIVAAVAVTLAMASKATYVAAEYGEGYGTATRTARVILERIQRCVGESYGHKEFPKVLLAKESGYDLPSILVVWNPAWRYRDPVERASHREPKSPTAGPLREELVVFAPKVGDPGVLVEIQPATDNQTAIDLPTANWDNIVAELRSPTSTNRQYELTDLVRSVAPETAANAPRAAAVFFERAAGAGAMGLRGEGWSVEQRRISIELQLQPRPQYRTTADGRTLPPVAYFGSAALYFTSP